MNLFSSESLAVAYSLAAAASWGTGDFSGGIATKRTSVSGVIILSQIAAIMLLLPFIFIFSEAFPSFHIMVLGAISGISGAVGMTSLYSGLAKGRMGIVAPVAAVVTVILPVIVGIFGEGLPPTYQIVGFGVAVIAVWLLSRSGSDAPIRAHELTLPIAAGCASGMTFIIIDRVSQEAILWPLLAARIVSLAILLAFSTMQKSSVLPPKHLFLPIFMTGIFDMGGNLLFALATRAGRLDISSVLSSLYPAVTVFLAWMILKERLRRQQWVGVIAAFAALALIAF